MFESSVWCKPHNAHSPTQVGQQTRLLPGTWKYMPKMAGPFRDDGVIHPVKHTLRAVNHWSIMCESKTIHMVQIGVALLVEQTTMKARKQPGDPWNNFTVIYNNTMLRVRHTVFRGWIKSACYYFARWETGESDQSWAVVSFFFCLCQEWDRAARLWAQLPWSRLTADCQLGFLFQYCKITG